MDWMGMDGYGWDLCVGLLYEHRFAMLITHHDCDNCDDCHDCHDCHCHDCDD